MFSKRAALAILVGVVAAGWLLYSDRGDDAAEPATDPVPRVTEPAAQDPVKTEPTAPSPDGGAVEPPPMEAPPPAEPEKAPPAFLYPEQLELADASWTDAPAVDVLNEIARKARFELSIPVNVQKILEGKRVTMSLGKTTGAIVIARVLQPYGLNYTVRDGTVHVFVDDD